MQFPFLLFFKLWEVSNSQKVIIAHTHTNGYAPGLATCIESLDFHSNTLRQIYQLSSFYRWRKWSSRFISVQFSSVTQSCPTLCNHMNCSTLGLPVHHQLLEFTQTHVHWVRDAIQPSRPLSSPSPPAPNPSQIRVFSNESALRIRWAKYWSFSFSHKSF